MDTIQQEKLDLLYDKCYRAGLEAFDKTCAFWAPEQIRQRDMQEVLVDRIVSAVFYNTLHVSLTNRKD